MADPQQDSGKTVLPPKPAIPSGREIYDLIMKDIEPELTSGNVKTLREKHIGESDDAKKERMSRYKKAFEKYEQKYKEYIASLREKVDAYREESLRVLEKVNDAKEANELAGIEFAISSL